MVTPGGALTQFDEAPTLTPGVPGEGTRGLVRPLFMRPVQSSGGVHLLGHVPARLERGARHFSIG